ncbi:FAD-dependent oxidoreductase [Parabacteroides johnsonii]|jgi:putative uncharacterized protein (fragment)|uniref:FAD-dependent oxidoreductase n=1 Tax=Parabacteroides johnsonii TaxID=387661 RepID=UPI0024328B66|nr:FAD-dependent oxidoreductase [Parabacteroides johnsonii]
MINRRKFIKMSACGTGLLSIGAFPVAGILKDANNDTNVSPRDCILPQHEVPVIADVDILIIGGTSGAVSAAVEAHSGGASVFVMAPMPYLGEDICGTLRFWLEKNEEPCDILSEALFPAKDFPTPLHIKTILEDELLRNNIPFLYSSYLVDFLYDKDKNIKGGIFVNRSGCQVILASTIIDATLEATGVRVGKILTEQRDIRQQKYEYTVIGNTKKQDSSICISEIQSMKVVYNEQSFVAYKYLFTLPDATDSFSLLNKLEHKVRDITWNPDQVDSSDFLLFVPSKRIKSKCKNKEEMIFDNIPIESYLPEGVSNFYTLNGFADISYTFAWHLLRPLSLINVGRKIGKHAVLHLKRIRQVALTSLHIGMNKQENRYAREVAKVLRPLHDKGRVVLPDKYLSVLGQYDVIVSGGGTSGAPAAISASRNGANTLMLEYLHGLGGLSTVGKVNRYWDGYREGFTKEIDRSVCDIAPVGHPRRRPKCVEWNSDWKMEWYRKELNRNNAEILFGSLCCGAVKTGNQVCGVVIATPYGRYVVLGKIIIDSTSSADVAIAAGAAYDFVGEQTEALQGGGLAWRNPGDFHNSTDWTFVDDADIIDVSRVFVAAKRKYKGMYDISKLPQTRERRRIIAEYNVSVNDLFTGRTYLDTVSHHLSSFDSHGYTVDRYLMLKPPLNREKLYHANLPYRSFIPKGLDGILVTGLAVGVHRDVIPVVRMQACLQNQGYAIGYIAAKLSKDNKKVRELDLYEIQRHLVAIGNLPDDVTKDNHIRFSDEQLAKAAESLINKMEGLEILQTDLSRSLPLIKACYNRKKGTPGELNYMKILGMYGDNSVSMALIDEIKRYSKWDKGWAFLGMGQFGPCMSQLDSLIIALGYTKRAEGVDVIVSLAKQLKPNDEFSHFRAICIAFETIASIRSVQVLYDLLMMPGMRGHSIFSYRQARNIVNNNRVDDISRNNSLKELYLAKALYCCGDKDNIGKSILEKYANDLRHNYALHASAVLKK